MKTGYVITHVNGDGMRRLTFGMQGRWTYDTREVAEKAQEAWKDPQGLPRILSPRQLATLRVDAVECYDHGDPVRFYITEEAA